MEIDPIIDTIYKLPSPSKRMLKEYISEIAYTKGEILLKANKVESTVCFIKKGIVRAYTDIEGNQLTFWFGTEGDTIVSMKSYVAGQKGYENIELLEDCLFYQIESRHLQQLFEKRHSYSKLGTKICRTGIIKNRIPSHIQAI